MFFVSPHDNSEMMLTPELSIHFQNQIGADIMMQLDDVVHTSVRGARVEEAMERSLRSARFSVLVCVVARHLQSQDSSSNLQSKD